MTQLYARSAPVEQLARLIRRLDRRQKAALLRLVPELQTIRPDELAIPAEQNDLLAYFDAKIATPSEVRPLRDSDPFLGGLTVAEFFAAPEAEQARIWDTAHTESLQTLNDYEHPIRPDAVSAR
ncbi:MAG TPA: hypothetical protein PKZ84_13865 [Anaerolineae bacterium]|nr:hypothetical protein [Anaerolineae bacterium]HQI85893.1 hypothetical protein [Anaerolineae bacterium]